MEANDLPVSVIGTIIHASMPKADAVSDKDYLAFLGVEGRPEKRGNRSVVVDLSSGQLTHDEA